MSQQRQRKLTAKRPLKAKRATHLEKSRDEETPRTRLSMAKAYSQGLVSEIMKDCDPGLMAKVRQDFDVRGEGQVDLNNFVRIMQRHLPHLNEGDLTELFLEVDINGDGTMEWDELTAFFVDKASVYEESKEDGFAVPFKYKVENDLHCMQDENAVQKVQYVDQLDAFFVLKNHSKTIRLYDARDLSSELGRLSGYNGIPICAEYIPNPPSMGSRIQPGRLLTSCSNLTLCLWQLAIGENQYSVQSCWPVPHAQSALCWVDKYRTLFTASVMGTLHMWDIDSRTEVGCAMSAHQDIGSALIYLEGIECIASGGMDAAIHIWDSSNLGKRQSLIGHNNGVYTLAYNQFHNLLFSGGIDHDGLVWSPFSRNVIYKLRGHKHSIVELHNVPGSEHQLVSGDTSGTLKLWDVRKYSCLQTFSAEPPDSLQNMNSFAIARGLDTQKKAVSVGPTPSSSGTSDVSNSMMSNSNHPPYISRILAGTKRLHVFEQCDPVKDMVSDSFPVIAACINTVSMSILTVTGRSVKIWDLLTGKQLRKYHNLMGSDVTTMCLDDRQRKFLLGDHAGRIQVYNYSSGAYMKSLDSHSAEVSKVLYCDGHKAVVSVSWDRNIVVHSELEPEHGIRLREMDSLLSHRGDITCADYLRAHIATGSLDKTVRVWDFFSGKLCNKLTCEADITVVQFLDGIDALCASDRSGRLYFWKMPLSLEDEKENRNKYTNLRQCPHRKSGEKSSVVAIAWCKENRRLFTGDEYGSLRTLTLGEEFQENPPVENWSLPNAHEDGITSISLAKTFNLLLTSSFDCCVRVYSMENGAPWGVLINGAGRGLSRSPFWNVPFDEEVMRVMGSSAQSLSRAAEEDSRRRGSECQRRTSISSRRRGSRMREDPTSDSLGGETKSDLETNQIAIKQPDTAAFHETVVFDESKQAAEEKDSKWERRKLVHKLISLPF